MPVNAVTPANLRNIGAAIIPSPQSAARSEQRLDVGHDVDTDEETATEVAAKRAKVSEVTVRRHRRKAKVLRHGVELQDRCEQCVATKRVYSKCIQLGAGTACLRCNSQGLPCSLLNGGESMSEMSSLSSRSSNSTMLGAPITIVGDLGWSCGEAEG